MRGLCNSIETARRTCHAIKDEVVTRVDEYDAIDVPAASLPH